MLPASIGHQPHMTTQPMSQGPGTMSINTIIEHPMGDLSFPLHQSIGEMPIAVGPTPLNYRHNLQFGPIGTADSPINSSDSCYSPISDYPGSQFSHQPFHTQEGIQRPRSTFSDSSFPPHSIASPLSAGPSFPTTWSSFESSPSYSDGNCVPTVGIRHLILPSSLLKTNSQADPLHVSLSNMGRQQWPPIRNQSASPAGMAVGQDGLLKRLDRHTRHHLECYWQTFHPLFPVVHQQSFVAANAHPLLATSMAMIGAQFSPGPDAKRRSASLFATCIELMPKVGKRRSPSPLSCLTLAAGESHDTLSNLSSADYHPLGNILSISGAVSQGRKRKKHTEFPESLFFCTNTVRFLLQNLAD